MKLYNKSGRAFIIAVKHIVEGGRFNEHDLRKDRKYFDPNTDIEVTDKYGEQLVRMYPKELKRFDVSPRKTVKTKKRSRMRLIIKKKRRA